MRDEDGTVRLLYARVCRPEGNADARVLVYNHGTGLTRFILQPNECGSEAMRWFLDRGFMVVQPIRRGYGATGGDDSANRAATPTGVRRCDDLRPGAIALEAARDTSAAIDYATALPGARPDGAVVLGVSTGGYTAMAYNSRSHPKVVAVVNVSGGIGGRMGGAIGQVCHADRMIQGSAWRYGSRTNALALRDK